MRLFFAAWPSPEIQQVLGRRAQALRTKCGGHAVPARNIHLTLVFLGDVERARLPRIEALAAAVSGRSFDLALDRVDYWAHNRVVWAGVEHCPDALQELAASLSRVLGGDGFRLEQRPYVPHVTLLREARRAPSQSAMPGIAWPVSRFALVESVPREKGRVYEVVRDWPLSE